MGIDEVDNEEDNLEFIGEIYIPLALNKKSIESNSNNKDGNFSMEGGIPRDRDLLFWLFSKRIRQTLGNRCDRNYDGSINTAFEWDDSYTQARDQLKACLRSAFSRQDDSVNVYINMRQSGLYIEFFRFRTNDGVPTMTPFYLSVHFRQHQLHVQHPRFEYDTVHRQPITHQQDNQQVNFTVRAIINGTEYDPNSDAISGANPRRIRQGLDSNLTFRFVPPFGGAARQNAAMMTCLNQTLFPDNFYIYVMQEELTGYMAGGRRLKYKKTKKTKRPKKSKKTRKTKKTKGKTKK